MLKQMYKGKKGKKDTDIPSQSRQKKYNVGQGECRWPIFLHDRVAENCNFKFELVDQVEGIQIVKLPAGTSLYHTTMVASVDAFWWKETFPFNATIGGVFFTSSQKHQTQFSGSHMLEYKTKHVLYMIFVQNITTTFGAAVGNEFITSFAYGQLVQTIEDKLHIKISGYMGCNECEIFIHNGDIKSAIYRNPTKVVNKLMYID